MSQQTLNAIEFGGEIEIVQATEGDKTPSFEIQAYNGGKLSVAGHRHPVVLELSSTDFERPVTKINRNHKQDREVGHTEVQTVSATGIFLKGLLSVPGKDRDAIVDAAKNKFPWDASIEASFPKPELVPLGKKIHINGRVQSGPFLLARGAVITGTAILNRGADRQTEVRIAAMENKKGVAGEGTGPSVRSEIERLQDSGMTLVEIGNMVDRSESTLSSILSGEIANPPAMLLTALRGISSKKSAKAGEKMKAKEMKAAEETHQQTLNAQADEFNEGLAAAVERADEIRTICAENGNPTIEVDGETVSLEAHAIRTKMSVKEARLEARLFDVDKRGGGAGQPFNIHTKSNLPVDLQQETLCAAMSMNHFGITEESAGKSYSEKAMNEASGRNNRQLGLHDVMGRICAAAGRPYHGPKKSMDFWSHTVEAQQHLQASGTTTLSLPNLFDNVLNKTSLDAFQSIEQMGKMIAHYSSVSDFKETRQIRLTAQGGYQEIGKDGEIKHVSLTDSDRRNQAKTYGAMMSLTRTDIINDDLGKLKGTASMLGLMAGQKLEEEIWVKFLGNDGNFFSAARKNLLTGTSLDPAGLSKARNAFLNRVNDNKKPITIGPAYLLTGIPQTDAANDLYTKTEYAVGNTSSGSKLVSAKNHHKGKYLPVVSPYISNTDITTTAGKSIPGQSPTDFYLIAMPTAMLSAINVVFLNGMQSPTTSTAEMEFNKLGMQFRSYHDFGVEYADKEAVVKVTA